jgi:hypothetical protein
MDQAAEPVPAQNPDVGGQSGWMRTAGGRPLLQRPVRAMQIAVIGVLVKDKPQVPFPVISIRSRHWRRALATQRIDMEEVDRDDRLGPGLQE